MIMKRIPLTRGMYAIVDDEDYEYLNQWKWGARKDHNAFYAVRGVEVNGRCEAILMHRVIADAKEGDEVDHGNGNGLDNTRKNIRICTHAENAKNRRLNKNSTTGFKGVSFKKSIN